MSESVGLRAWASCASVAGATGDFHGYSPELRKESCEDAMTLVTVPKRAKSVVFLICVCTHKVSNKVRNAEIYQTTLQN
jgi:hypothetical protein